MYWFFSALYATGLKSIRKSGKAHKRPAFYIVTPAIIIQSFSSVEMSGENVRGMLMSFLGGTILHVVAIVICIPFWRRTDKICRAYISMRRYTEMSAIWHCRSPRQSSEPRACSFARAC